MGNVSYRFKERELCMRRKGFTLIELLVVISIIALLLAILMPALNMAKQKGRQVVCASHLRGIGLAVTAYLTDYDDTFHFGSNNGMWENWVNGSGEDLEYDHSYAYWGVTYSAYTSGKEVFACPSARIGDIDCWLLPGEQFAGRQKSEVFGYFKNCAYGLNSYMNSYGTTKIKSLKFKRPSEVIYAQDHIEQLLDSPNSDMFCIGPGDTMNLMQWRGITASYPHLYTNVIEACFRHSRKAGKNGVSNTLWLDGHVATIGETDGEDVPVKWYAGKDL